MIDNPSSVDVRPLVPVETRARLEAELAELRRVLWPYRAIAAALLFVGTLAFVTTCAFGSFNANPILLEIRWIAILAIGAGIASLAVARGHSAAWGLFAPAVAITYRLVSGPDIIFTDAGVVLWLLTPMLLSDRRRRRIAEIEALLREETVQVDRGRRHLYYALGLSLLFYPANFAVWHAATAYRHSLPKTQPRHLSVFALLLSGASLLFLVFVTASFHKTADQGRRAVVERPPEILQAPGVEISLLEGWRRDTEADRLGIYSLVAIQPEKDIRLAVMRVAKSDLVAPEREAYLAQAAENLKSRFQPIRSFVGPTATTFGERPASLLQIDGGSNGTFHKLTGVIVEAPRNYYLITVWGIASTFDRHETELIKAVNHVRIVDEP